MIKRFKLGYVVSIFILASFLCTNLFAQSWITTSKRYFENDEYQKCIDYTEKYKKKNNFANMFLAFSHLQENVFNKTKYDMEKFKAYKTMLEARLSVKDIDNLLYFINLNDKPYVVKEARKLSKNTFKNIKNIEDIPALMTFLNSTDAESRKLALGAIKNILSPKRKYVDQGGTMRAKDIKVMNSKNLITSLLENIEQNDAKKALEIIEEPVLEHTSGYAGVNTTKLETKINQLIAKRKKKFPDSNWYSATGKTR